MTVSVFVVVTLDITEAKIIGSKSSGWAKLVIPSVTCTDAGGFTIIAVSLYANPIP
jgi:hypothetical protein